MEERTGFRPSTLFTVRLWVEENEEGQQEWRGIVRRLPDGKEHPFRGWPALSRVMQEKAQESSHD